MLLEGEKSTTFSLEQGVAQGCSLSPILFSVFIDDLLREVEKADLGIQLGGGKKVGGMDRTCISKRYVIIVKRKLISCIV